MRAILLVALILAAVQRVGAAPEGFTLTFGEPSPEGVRVSTAHGVHLRHGYAAFTVVSSSVDVIFTVPRAANVSRWSLDIVDRADSERIIPTGPGGISARLFVDVNGHTVASANVISSAFVSHRIPVGRLLRYGTNQIHFRLGSDSTSVLDLRSVHVGP